MSVLLVENASRCHVTVLVPVYNGETFLREAVDSVLHQRGLEDFEVLVLDDGSQDASFEILNSYHGPHIILRRHTNRGLAATLNRGIELARGTYIARQDQDDISLPGRLEKQKSFLDENPNVAMVGTWAEIYVGDKPTNRFHRHPVEHETLKLELLFDNPFVHSSMMIRADVLRKIGGYCENKSRQPPEDYELWSRIAREYHVANIPEVLTVYREMPNSMSRTCNNPFLTNVIQISAENLHYILSSQYTIQDCSSLAELYHRGGISGFKSELTKESARKMLCEAGHAIAGPQEYWTNEFSLSFHKMRAHIDSRFLQRKIPKALLGPASWLKRHLKTRL